MPPLTPLSPSPASHISHHFSWQFAHYARVDSLRRAHGPHDYVIRARLDVLFVSPVEGRHYRRIAKSATGGRKLVLLPNWAHMGMNDRFVAGDRASVLQILSRIDHVLDRVNETHKPIHAEMYMEHTIKERLRVPYVRTADLACFRRVRTNGDLVTERIMRCTGVMKRDCPLLKLKACTSDMSKPRRLRAEADGGSREVSGQWRQRPTDLREGPGLGLGPGIHRRRGRGLLQEGTQAGVGGPGAADSKTQLCTVCHTKSGFCS